MDVAALAVGGMQPYDCRLSPHLERVLWRAREGQQLVIRSGVALAGLTRCGCSEFDVCNAAWVVPRKERGLEA